MAKNSAKDEAQNTDKAEDKAAAEAGAEAQDAPEYSEEVMNAPNPAAAALEADQGTDKVIPRLNPEAGTIRGVAYGDRLIRDNEPIPKDVWDEVKDLKNGDDVPFFLKPEGTENS